MTLNNYRVALPAFPFQAQEDSEELLHGVYMKGLEFRLNAEVTVAGGAGDGVLLAEGVQRLIRRIRVIWDGVTLVDVDGRGAVQISRHVTAQNIAPTALAIPGIQAATPIEVIFRLPFERQYLARPFETVLPPLTVRQQLRLYIDWEPAANVGVGSDPGTGALIFGGDRAVTFNVQPNLTVTQIYATKGKMPWYLPGISSFDAEAFAAANPRLEATVRSSLRFDMAMIRTVQGANAEPQDAINTASLLAGGGVRFIDTIPLADLRAEERFQFPGVNTNQPGYVSTLFADGGLLGNVLNPNSLSNPRWEFDLAAPTAAPGQLRIYTMDLLAVPGVTVIEK